MKKKDPSIALFTGTFGQEVQNGVGRFLGGIQQWSRDEKRPLHVYSSGNHVEQYPGVKNIHALSFPVPGFEAINAYYPLEGRRDQVRRNIEDLTPDIVHLSTPEPIAMTGQSIAHEMDIPIAATYHTDFPAFIQKLVHDSLTRIVEERGAVGTAKLLGGKTLDRFFEEVNQYVPRWEQWVLKRIFSRILKRYRPRIDELLAEGIDRVSGAAEQTVRELMHQFYHDCQLVIARSEYYNNKIVEELGMPAENVKTLQAGTDTALFSPEKTSADQGLRSRLGIPEQAKVVLYVGRVTDEKNVDFLADAWQRYQSGQQADDTVLVMVGTGQTEAFHKRAGKNVHMLGARHGEELSAIYRMADTFWTASSAETLGQVVLEAQASGVPTMVSDQGAAQENVIHGQTGLVLPVDDPGRWSAALSEMLGQPDKRKSMSNMARRSTEHKTIEDSYKHFWKLHADLYRRLEKMKKMPLCGQLPIRVLDSTPTLAVDMTYEQSTHCSDFHAGHGARQKDKEAALRILMERTFNRGADLYLHGDFTDTRPKLPKMQRQLRMLRGIMRDLGVTPKLYIEGNHDYEFARDGAIPELVGAELHPSLVGMTDDGLGLTHGHVSEIKELPQILQQSTSPQEIIDALAVDKLKDRLKQTAMEYDVIGVIENWFEDAGLEGIEDLWRNVLPYRQRMVDTLLNAAHARGLDTEVINAGLHMIGSAGREETLAKLAAGLDGWAMISGHTHEPGLQLQTVMHPRTQTEVQILLANCGSFRRRSLPPTWVERNGKTVELYAYDRNEKAAVLVESMTHPMERTAA